MKFIVYFMLIDNITLDEIDEQSKPAEKNENNCHNVIIKKYRGLAK